MFFFNEYIIRPHEPYKHDISLLLICYNIFSADQITKCHKQMLTLKHIMKAY